MLRSKFKIFLFLINLIELVVFKTGTTPSNFLRFLKSLLINFIDETDPQYIVNFASHGMVAESWNDPVHWYKTNIISQVSLHDELRKRSFLNVSKCDVSKNTLPNGFTRETCSNSGRP